MANSEKNIKKFIRFLKENGLLTEFEDAFKKQKMAKTHYDQSRRGIDLSVFLRECSPYSSYIDFAFVWSRSKYGNWGVMDSKWMSLC